MSREEAREFERTTKITAKLGVMIAPQSGKNLDEGILEYSKLRTSEKVSKADEKLFLAEFYRFMVHELEITQFSQVKLIHFEKYQKFLQQGSERKRIWYKAESARKREFEADTENAKKEFVPAKPPRMFSDLSGSSVNRHLNSIRDLFSAAKKWEWITENPTADLDNLIENPKSHKPWPNNEMVQNVLNKAKEWARRPTFLIVRTGIRPIVTTILTWSQDVDMANRRFRVVSKKGSGEIKVHWIPMTDDVYEFFVFMWNNRQVGKYSDFVFHSAEGCRLNSKRLAREIARCTKLLGYSGYTLYSSRVKLATDMANPSANRERVGDLKAASKTLGHASLNQTLVYDRTQEIFIKEALEKVSKENVIEFRRQG